MSLRDFTFVAFAGLGFAFVAGCGSQSSLDSSTPCHSDGDCASGQTCRQAKAPGATPQVAYNPCMNLTPCTDTAQCTSGLVCGPYTGITSPAFGTCPAMICQAPCQAGSCLTDEVCSSDGVCRFQSCDEAGAPVCSEHYRCDPTAAAAVGVSPLPISGSSVSDGANVTREAARGCVRKACDEDGGFVCRELWTCDPPNAMSEPSGCTPDPCAESGQCSSTAYICDPTSDGPHPTGMDVHGCVQRNCEEGYQCVYMPEGTTNYAHCDVDAERADTYGCVITRCDEEPGCRMGYVCDPAGQNLDPRGCRVGRCDEAGGSACPASYVCDAESASANTAGCVYVPAATGGTGGTGGTGVGGTGAGGVGALGGSGGTAARGGSGGSGATGGTGATGSGGSSIGGSTTTGGTGAVGSGGASGSSGAAGSGMTGMCVAAG